jgi:hypothetical protein
MLYKKKTTSGACVALLLLSGVTAVPTLPLENSKEEPCTLILRIGPGLKGEEYEYQHQINLTTEEANHIIDTVQRLDNKLSNARNSKEAMRIFKEKLKVLRDVGILPSSFTLENVNKTAKVLAESLHIRKNASAIPSSLDNNQHSRWPWYFGIGGGVIFFAPGGLILHFGQPMSEELVTGDRIDIPIFEEWWEKIGKEVYLVFAYGGGGYKTGFLIGSCYTIAVAIAFFGFQGVEMVPFPQPSVLSGLFISVLGPFAGGYMTFLLKYGKKTVDRPLLDIIFVAVTYIGILPVWV